MITLEQYFMGRDRTHALQLSTELRANAWRTVEAANKLLVLAKGAGVRPTPGLAWGMVRSGWRPPDINATTKNASRTSLHMQCLAIDIEDNNGELRDWALKVASTVLRDLALWLEHPSATPSWCHVQLKPPGSGNRVFLP